MNADVELGTATGGGDVAKVTVIATKVVVFVYRALSQVVPNFALPVVSMGSHSISAVAPNSNLRKELAKAGA